MNVAWLNVALNVFAKAFGARENKQILLGVDGAGWHRSANVEVSEELHLEILLLTHRNDNRLNVYGIRWMNRW